MHPRRGAPPALLHVVDAFGVRLGEQPAATAYERLVVDGRPVVPAGAASTGSPFWVFAGETVVYERALIDATGRSRWIRGRMVPDHRIDGAIQGVYVVLHDITDLKSAQDTLAARESQLRAVMDGVPAPALKGCKDIDLGCSPSTNTLPIRRLRLAVGASAAAASISDICSKTA